MQGTTAKLAQILANTVAGVLLLTCTPLCAQTPSSRVLSPDSDVLQRLKNAYGGARLDQSDSLAEATVTLQTATGPVAVPVTIVRSAGGGQRIQFNQSNGKPWDGNALTLEPIGRRVLEFVQTGHARALLNIFKATSRNAQVVDSGASDGARLLDVRETSGASTRYSLDASTFQLRRMDFQRGQSVDAAGKIKPLVETYLYSDFRPIAGISTAFKVEHYSNGTKQEELTFTNVRYVQANPAAANTMPGGQR